MSHPESSVGKEENRMRGKVGGRMHAAASATANYGRTYRAFEYESSVYEKKDW